MQPVIKRKGKVVSPADLTKYNLPPPIQPTAVSHGNSLSRVGTGAKNAQKTYDAIAAKHGVRGPAPVLPQKLVNKYAKKQQKVDRREGRVRKAVGVNQRMDDVISKLEKQHGTKKTTKKPSTRVKRDMQKVLDGGYSKAKMKKCAKTRGCKATIGKRRKQQHTKEGARIYVGQRGGFYSIGPSGRKRYHHFDNIDNERPAKRMKTTHSTQPKTLKYSKKMPDPNEMFKVTMAPKPKPKPTANKKPTNADVNSWFDTLGEEGREMYNDNYEYFMSLPEDEQAKILKMVGTPSVWAMFATKQKVNYKRR